MNGQYVHVVPVHNVFLSRDIKLQLSHVITELLDEGWPVFIGLGNKPFFIYQPFIFDVGIVV